MPLVLLFLVYLLSCGNLWAKEFDGIRGEVIMQLSNIEANHESGQLRVYVNDLKYEDNPRVQVGESIRFTIQSFRKRYIFILLVDPEGKVNAVFPDRLVSSITVKHHELVFPQDDNGELVQSEPVGVMSMLVLAATKPIEIEHFDRQEKAEIYDIPGSSGSLDTVVKQLNELFENEVVNGSWYDYRVVGESRGQTNHACRLPMICM